MHEKTFLFAWPVGCAVRVAAMLLPCKACDKHCVCVQYSYMLAELFRNPVIIAHHRGHVVPGLDEERLEQLRSFLRARLHDSTL